MASTSVLEKEISPSFSEIKTLKELKDLLIKPGGRNDTPESLLCGKLNGDIFTYHGYSCRVFLQVKEHYKISVMFEVPIKTIPVKISDKEVERIYKKTFLTEVLGERAEEMLRLVDEKLEEEKLEVSDEVKQVIANFMVMIGKKVSELDV